MDTHQLDTLQNFTLTDIKNAYEGEANACCCGCQGEHYKRGDADRDVMRILRMVQALSLSANADMDFDKSYVAATAEGTTFIVYLNDRNAS